MAQEFSAHVAGRIGWYVYLLRNPLDGTLFYVGKGVGNRAHQHAKDAVALADEVKPKLETIRAIHAAGREVGVEILRHGLASEKVACEVEAAVIDAYGATGLDLTNLVAGHGGVRGWATVDVVVSLYDAPPAPPIDEPVILIRLPKLWYPTMSDEELYEATRGWWGRARKVGRARSTPRRSATASSGVSTGSTTGASASKATATGSTASARHRSSGSPGHRRPRWTGCWARA